MIRDGFSNLISSMDAFTSKVIKMKVVKLVNIFGVDFKRFSLVGWKHEQRLAFRFSKDCTGCLLHVGKYDFEFSFNNSLGCN